MDIVELLKDNARQIITFTGDKAHGAKTWDEQPSAPEGGFTDRAGFVLIDNIESYADIALVKQDEAMLRARVAQVTGEGTEERFLIIGLDFSADRDSIKNAIREKAHISSQILIDILDQAPTVPKLIRVSYNTGRDDNDNLVGVRYEYSRDQAISLSRDEQAEFAKTLRLTLSSIIGNHK